MIKKIYFIVLILSVYCTHSAVVVADAPAEGLVIEGVSVPGIALGDTRQFIANQYGSPQSCSSGSVHGDLAYCQYPVVGGGYVSVRYKGANGGNAANKLDDIASNISWDTRVNWETTAGVTAALVLNNPEAAAQAYPDAEITYHWFTGEIFRISDYKMGISIFRMVDYYSPIISVSIGIFYPQTEN